MSFHGSNAIFLPVFVGTIIPSARWLDRRLVMLIALALFGMKLARHIRNERA